MARAQSEDLEDEEPPKNIDPYAVLSLEKDATPDQVKAAYRKAALLNHPDKVPADQKPTAHAKFQEIAFAYAILSDARRRSRYDATGRTEETLSLDDDDDDFNWSDFFRAQFTDVVTEASVEAFRKEYKGSEEEREAILDAYTRGKGNMDRVYEAVMLSEPLEDDERFRGVIESAIRDGEVEVFKKFSEESEASKKRRLDRARKEAEEADEYVRELEEEKKGGKGKKAAAKGGKKGGKNNDLGSLAALIQQRQKGRAQDFLADLEAKYGGGKKRGSPALDEPPEEAFKKTAARSKKAKATKEEVDVGIESSSKRRRTKK